MNESEFKIKVFSLKDKLYRFSNRILSDSTEAEDITQDVLVKLWNTRKDLAKLNSIEAYAMTLTRNLSLDKARRKNKRFEKQNDIAYHTETVFNEKSIEENEIKRLVNQAINRLKEPQKTIIYLRDIEGYHFEEIQSIVSMNVETIRVNLSRARKKVREELKKIMSYGTV